VTGRKASFEVPYLPAQHIEREANLLLAEYAAKTGVTLTPPIPIDEIIEFHLNVTIEIVDLVAELGVDDVLGAIWFDSSRIAIDCHLDPSVYPNALGRYKFTLAHESGHWRLHRKLFMSDPNQGKLIADPSEPSYVCRRSESPPVEVQANMFAAHLLMPKKLVVSAWQCWRGSLDPVHLSDLPALNGFFDRNPNNVRMEQFVRPLAAQFEVSAEAMRIRLEALGLLQRKQVPSLF
jgi:hypothetical protein